LILYFLDFADKRGEGVPRLNSKRLAQCGKAWGTKGVFEFLPAAAAQDVPLCTVFINEQQGGSARSTRFGGCSRFIAGKFADGKSG